MSEWQKYEGTDEQIAEMLNAEYGFIARWESYVETLKYSGDCSAEYITDILGDFTDYLICNPHPLADMIARWAETGQPVWVRYKKDLMVLRPGDKAWRKEIIVTTTPDWNIPGAEYSFAPFEEGKQ